MLIYACPGGEGARVKLPSIHTMPVPARARLRPCSLRFFATLVLVVSVHLTQPGHSARTGVRHQRPAIEEVTNPTPLSSYSHHRKDFVESNHQIPAGSATDLESSRAGASNGDPISGRFPTSPRTAVADMKLTSRNLLDSPSASASQCVSEEIVPKIDRVDTLLQLPSGLQITNAKLVVDTTGNVYMFNSGFTLTRIGANGTLDWSFAYALDFQLPPWTSSTLFVDAVTFDGNAIMVTGYYTVPGTGDSLLFLAAFDLQGAAVSCGLFEGALFVPLDIAASGGQVYITGVGGGTPGFPFLACFQYVLSTPLNGLSGTFEPQWAAHVEARGTGMVTVGKLPESAPHNPCISFYQAFGQDDYSSGASAMACFNSTTGELLWMSELPEAVIVNSIASLPGGGLAVGGTFQTSSGAVYYPLVLVYTSGGEVQWANVLNGTSTAGAYVSCITVAPDGGIVAAGTTASNAMLLLYTFNSSGSLLWAETVRVKNQVAVASLVSSLPLGGIALAGWMCTGVGFCAGLPNTFLILTTAGMPTFPTAVADGITVTKLMHDILRSAAITPSSPSFAVIPLNITAVGQQPPASACIPSATGFIGVPPSAYTYQLKTPVFVGVADAVSTILWTYTIPYSVSFPGSSAAVPLEFTARIYNASWMSYDATTQTLSGYPLQTSDGVAVVVVTPKSLYVKGVGTFHFPPYQLTVCVDAAPSTFFATIGTQYHNGFDVVASSSAIAMIQPGEPLCLFFGAQGSVLALTSVAPLQLPSGVTFNGWDNIATAGQFNLSSSLSPPVILAGSYSTTNVGNILVASTVVTSLAVPPVATANVTVEWSVQLALLLPGSVGSIVPNAVSVASDGSVGLTGSVFVGGAEFYVPSQLFVALLSPNGVLTWFQVYGYGSVGSSITFGGNRSLIVAGTSYRANILCKFSFGGDLEWAYGSDLDYSYYGDRSSTVVSLPDGRIVSLYTASMSKLSSSPLAMFTPDGLPIWALSFPKSIVNAVSLSLNNSLIITGIVDPGDASAYLNNNAVFFLASLDLLGNLLWTKSLCSGPYSGSSIDVADNGDIIVSGYSADDTDGFLARFSARGDIYPAFTSDSCPLAAGSLTMSLIPTVNLQPVTDFQLDESISASNVTATPITMAITPASGSLVSHVARSGYISIPPYIQVPFGAPYSLNISALLQPGTSLTTLSGPSEADLPSWLSLDPDTSVMTGRPYGSVRYLYCLQATMEWTEHPSSPAPSTVVGSASFCLNVTNSAPYYIGPVHFKVGAGDVSLDVRSNFRDNENDTVGNFGLWMVNGEDPSLQGRMDPLLGIFTASVTSSDSNGLHLFNITASDPFGTVGWFILTVDVQLPPQWLLALQQYWPFLVSGLVLVCVVGALWWRDRRSEWTQHAFCVIATRWIDVHSPVTLQTEGALSRLKCSGKRDEITQLVASQLNSEGFEPTAVFADFELLLADAIRVSCSGFLDRDFIASLGLGDTLQKWTEVTVSRLVNNQLEDLRASLLVAAQAPAVYTLSGLVAMYSYQYHRRTLIVLHLLNRLLETTLLCYGLQIPDPTPVDASYRPTAVVRLWSALCQRVKRKPQARQSRLRHGVGSATLTAWLQAVNDVNSIAGNPLVGLKLPELGCSSEARVVVEVQIFHSLARLRQAVLCLPETSTSLDLLVQSLSKLLAPADMFADLMSLIADVPSRWYSILFEARLVAQCLMNPSLPPHTRQVDLLRLQRHLYYACFSLSGSPAGPWNLVYGCVELLGSLLLCARAWTVEERQQLMGVTSGKDGVLTLRMLAGYPGFRLQPEMRRWIQEAARAVLDDPEGMLPVSRGSLHRFPLLHNPLLRAPAGQHTALASDSGLFSIPLSSHDDGIAMPAAPLALTPSQVTVDSQYDAGKLLRGGKSLSLQGPSPASAPPPRRFSPTSAAHNGVGDDSPHFQLFNPMATRGPQ